jgi:hypothetical protein
LRGYIRLSLPNRADFVPAHHLAILTLASVRIEKEDTLLLDMLRLGIRGSAVRSIPINK